MTNTETTNDQIDVACPNCTWTGRADDLNAIAEEGIFDRVSPGEIMPYGECPECGALAHAAPSSEQGAL